MHPPSLCSFDLGIDFYGVDCDLGFADCTKGLSLVMVVLEEVESTDTNYLRALILTVSYSTIKIKRRMMAANRCSHGLQRHLRSQILTIKTKFAIYKTLLIS